MKKRKFNFRSFTSLILVWTFIVQIISGVILYIVPPGRVANWTGWKLFGIDKGGWEAVHTIFGYLFLIFGVFHIIYNWRPISNYIKGKIEKGLKLKKEMLLSSLIILLIFAGTLFNIPPFKTVMDFGEKLKNSWSVSENSPDIPHLELKSLKEITETINMDAEKAIDILKEKGINIKNINEKLIDIAEENKTTPQKIYEYLQKKLTSEEAKLSTGGTGYGSKTIYTIAEENGISVEQALSILRDNGITAKKDEKLKDIAERVNKTPYEIAEIIAKSKNK